MEHNFIFSDKIILWHIDSQIQPFPWQLNKTIYNVWLSEIMLQQTQVITVIPYYKNFIKKFPTIFQLATAELNEILYLWSGLGYYKRATNLQKTAKIIVEQYFGQFPSNLKTLISLPGIGRSTAGAILSLALNKPYPILDGNIKRILIRYYLLNFDTSKKSTLNNKLWSLIETLIPQNNAAIFNQAMMDLGRLICTNNKPKCNICPINNHCQSFLKNEIKPYLHTVITHTQKKSKQMVWWIILCLKTDYMVWLTKRSQENIWKELFCFPEFYNLHSLKEWLLIHQLQNKKHHNMTTFKHQISNICLNIQPILIIIEKKNDFNKKNGIWYNLYKPAIIGLPKPILTILNKIKISLYEIINIQ